MRDALRLPLTPEQLAMMRAAGADILSSSASCYLLSHKQSDRQITGVARVSVQLRSKYSKTVRNLPEAELRITIRSNGSVGLDARWAVESVEQIA